MHCRSFFRVSRAVATGMLAFGVFACSSQQPPIPQREMPPAVAQAMLNGPPEPGKARVIFYLGRTSASRPFGSQTEHVNVIPVVLVVADTRVGGVNRNDVLLFDLPAGDYDIYWIAQTTQGDGIASEPQRIRFLSGSKVFLAAMRHMPGPHDPGAAWIEPQPIYGPSIAAGKRPVFPTSLLNEAPPPGS